MTGRDDHHRTILAALVAAVLIAASFAIATLSFVSAHGSSSSYRHRLCLGLNHITYRDRQTIKFTPEKEREQRLLYAMLGFRADQIDVLIAAQKRNAQVELARRTFARCKGIE